MDTIKLKQLEEYLNLGNSFHLKRKFNDARNYYIKALELCSALYKGASNDKDKENLTSLIRKITDKVKKCQTTFDDVVGLEDFKEFFNESVLRVARNQELAEEYNVSASCCILLHGKPGTGKTFAIKAAANEFPEAKLIETKASALIDSLVGQTAKNVAKLFDDAIAEVKSNPNLYILIMFDEVDGIARSRNSDDKGSKEAMNTLLTYLSAIASENYNIIIIGATNTPDQIDKAFLSRFGDNVFYIPLPTEECRIKLLKNNISKLDDNIDWSLIGQKTEGLSGRDLKFIANKVNEVAFAKTDKMIEAGLISKGDKANYAKITNDMLLATITTAKERIKNQKYNHLGND